MKLLTRFTKSASTREGYLDLSTIMDPTLQQYTFNSVFKLKEFKPFDTWVLYYEDSPVAVRMTVRSDVMANGNVRVLIIDRNVVGLDEVPPVPSSAVKYYDETKPVKAKSLKAAVKEDANLLTDELRAAIFGTTEQKPVQEEEVPVIQEQPEPETVQEDASTVPDRRYTKYVSVESQHYTAETRAKGNVLTEEQKAEAVQRVRNAWGMAQRGK